MIESVPERLTDGTITLRRYRPDDVAALKESTTASHEHLRRYMPWALDTPTDESAMGFVTFAADGFATSGNANYAITLAADGTYVGGCGIHDRVGPDALEIGYWVDVRYVRRGVATATAKLLTDACFAVGAERVVICCDASNDASAGVARRLGYTRADGGRRQGSAGRSRDGGDGPHDGLGDDRRRLGAAPVELRARHRCFRSGRRPILRVRRGDRHGTDDDRIHREGLVTLAAVLQPTPLLGRPVLMTVFIAVLALSSFGLGGAIYNVVISTRRLADVPKPAGSPERVVAQGIRRIGIGRIVMLLAAIAFASIALAASIQNTFGMTANIFGAAFIAAICAPGVVTTVLTAFEINERIRIDRIYRALPTTATKRSERVASRRSELSSRSA